MMNRLIVLLFLGFALGTVQKGLAQEYGKGIEIGGKAIVHYTSLNTYSPFEFDLGLTPRISYGVGLTSKFYLNAYRKGYFGAEIVYLRTGHKFEASRFGFTYEQNILQHYISVSLMLGVRINKPRPGSWFVYGGFAPMYLADSRVRYRYTYSGYIETRSFANNPFESFDLGGFVGTSYSPKIAEDLYLTLDLRIQMGLLSSGMYTPIAEQNRPDELHRHFVQLSVGIEKPVDRGEASRAGSMNRRLSQRDKIFEDVTFKCGDRYARMDKKTKKRIKKLARYIENHPDILKIVITGHADPAEPGDPATVDRISRHRANVIKEYIKREIKRKKKRRWLDDKIIVEYKGASAPKYPKGDPRNCRAEITFQTSGN